VQLTQKLVATPYLMIRHEYEATREVADYIAIISHFELTFDAGIAADMSLHWASPLIQTDQHDGSCCFHVGLPGFCPRAIDPKERVTQPLLYVETGLLVSTRKSWRCGSNPLPDGRGDKTQHRQ
jgi:hypothetical protein